MSQALASLVGFTVVVGLAVAAPPARAAGGAAPVEPSSADRDYVQARRAIDARRWAEAVTLLEKAASRQSSNADVYNLLGYAERQRGNLDAAFAHYEKALRLNPRHRGAHEYVGEAYLQVGDLPKAREHLAALERLCSSRCEEYRELREKVAGYEREHPSTR